MTLASTAGEGTTAYVALGSNLGDRHAMIDAAIRALDQTAGIHITTVSELIQTEPLGPSGQSMYLNAAAKLETTLSPRKLLETCLAIERTLGRDRRHTVRWGPREIDIDLLTFADMVIDEPGLKIPHPHLHERSFVLTPLAEIAPQLMHPVLGETIESLCRDLAASAGPGVRLE